MEGTFVDYFQTSARPTKCGYCKSPDTSYTQGVWGYQMKCQDFQTLVDRGFQRSGNYVYRPMMKETCCSQYVVRMDVAKFKLSKSQKSAIKKFKRYLVEGRKDSTKQEDAAPVDVTPQQEGVPVSDASIKSCQGQSSGGAAADMSTDPQPQMSHIGKLKVKKAIHPGVGPDPNKPPCKKAKIIRQERKTQKQLLAKQQPEGASFTTVSSSINNNNTAATTSPLLAKQQPEGASLTPVSSSINNTAATTSPKLASEQSGHPVLSQNLSEYLQFHSNEEECLHKFRTRLIPAKMFNNGFAETREESYLVFRKFQTIVHAESEEEAKEQQFKDFLINTPLISEKHTDSITYGSFHLQYLLDEKIFAVGVLDILPKGVLCEYLYYDPSYRFIAPGVLSALMEISLTQQYYLQDCKMQYYYMGYYVQSCPKMNYKRRYSAGALLCPETNTYVALEKCIPILKQFPYSRLADPEIEDSIETCSDEELGGIPLLTPGGVIMKYRQYKEWKGVEVDSVTREYMELVGKALALSMKVHMPAIDAASATTESANTESGKMESGTSLK